MSETSLIFFSYISRIRCAPAEIDRIIAESCQRNLPLKMSGALVHDSTHFLQFLEGPRAASADTILRILSDRRHDEMTILTAEPTQVRLFTNWHMKRLHLMEHGKTLRDHMTEILNMPQADRGFSLRRFALELEHPDA